MSDYTLSAFSSSRVTLKDSSNWESWLATIEGIANQFGVWDLCDPKHDTEPPLPELPTKPDWKKVKEANGEDWYHVYNIENDEYKDKLSSHNKKLQGLNVVANAIRNSLHQDYQVFIDQKTPWGLLRNLRQRLSPECDPTYKASLRAAWRNLDRGLDKDTDIDKWLLNWQTLQTRCAKAGITEASEASIQFLEAISVISPEFYAAWVVLIETSIASTKTEEQRQADFGSLLTRYRAHWLITHGKPAQQRNFKSSVFNLARPPRSST
ncbi:hypothetical protein N7524_010973 [Penicillium chrysogenum]|jgi:hypothetical protein|nr:hypothetical protein N7524_010973 [Penicillium chrysogenum]